VAGKPESLCRAVEIRSAMAIREKGNGKYRKAKKGAIGKQYSHTT